MEKKTAWRRLRRTSMILGVSFLLSVSVSAHPGSGIAVDRTGQVYFLDTGSGLWRIDTRGNLTHLSRTLFHWLAIDANDCFANSRLPSGSLGDILRVGNNPTLLLSSDYPIAIGQDGNLYYPSRGSKGQTRMMRLLPSGETSLLATIAVQDINGITPGPDNSIYYTENNSIRRINAQGAASTVVTIRALAGGPSIPGNTQHPYLRGLAIDTSGAIYVADSGDARVLKMTRDGKVSTIVQLQSPWSPTAVAVFGSDIYALEFLHTSRDVRRDWSPRVRKIASDGTSTVIATLDQMPGAR
jgi:SMP-30/gluconolaconase/LRE-like protein